MDEYRRAFNYKGDEAHLHSKQRVSGEAGFPGQPVCQNVFSCDLHSGLKQNKQSFFFFYESQGFTETLLKKGNEGVLSHGDPHSLSQLSHKV